MAVAEPGTMAGQALSGLKVLDFTQALAGPIAGRLMADQGAMVIHVESVTRVDLERVIPPFKGQKPGVNLGLVFADFEAGKYGVTLNMESPRGRQVAARLVAVGRCRRRQPHAGGAGEVGTGLRRSDQNEAGHHPGAPHQPGRSGPLGKASRAMAPP